VPEPHCHSMPVAAMPTTARTATPRVASIVIYPAAGQQDSAHQYLSALAAYSKSLLGNLSQAAQQQHVVLTNLKAGRPAVHYDGALRVDECWRKGSFLFWWQILRALRAYPNLAVVHVQHEFNQFGSFFTIPFIPIMIGVIRFILRKKTAITFHEVIPPDRLNQAFLTKSGIPVPAFLARALLVNYYRFVAASASVIFVQDEIFADALHAMRIRRPLRILRIGTDQDVPLLERAAARRALGYTDADHVLLFFGTVDWRKGLDLLLEVFQRMQNPQLRLIIAGGQPVRIRTTREYQAWHAALLQRATALAPRVAWHGFIAHDQLAQLMAATDLVVLPYVVPQRVSAVLNTAASYEKPCIASQYLAGQADPITLFPATPEALAAKITWALAHLDVLQQAARAFKKKNDWRISAAVLEQTYGELLAGSLKFTPQDQ